MKPRAFTLLELLVVIATIAVILSIALPALHGARERARAGRCLSNLRSIATYTSKFVDDNNRLPDPFNTDDDLPDLRCPCAVDPDTGVYGFPGQMPSSGAFVPTTWIGRALTLNPAKVSVVMCPRHTPYSYGFLDGHAR